MNEGLVGLLFILGIGAIVFFVLKHAFQQANQLDEVYAQVARGLGGHSAPGGFLGRPFVNFSYAGGPAKIDINSTGGKHPKLYTQLHLTWPDADLRCEVYPEHILHGVGKMLGMTDIQLGSPEFDPLFMITGNSEEAIRRLLSNEVQLEIDRLRRFLGNNDIYISIHGGRLLIKKRTLIRDLETLKRFVRLGVRLHEVASLTNAEGIEFANGEQSEATLSLASAICQVCGDEIVLEAVFCRSCKTPHHRDCWQYYGSCSTYGCGQPRFLVEKKEVKSSPRGSKRRQ